jgi:hypothetical protein
MRVNRGLLGWGVFFLALGAVPIAVESGLLDAATARRAWELWPLLLIGVGLGLALRNTAVEALGGVLVALTFGLMVGGLVAGGFGATPPFVVCGAGGDQAASPAGQPVTGTLGAEASVDLSADCGALTLVTAPGSQWSISWPADSASNPEVLQADSARLRVAFGRNHGFGIGDPAARWDMTFPADPRVGLSVSVNAGSAKLSFDGAHVSSLSGSVNAGDARIDLSKAVGTASVSGSANAGSLSIALPTPEGTLTGSVSANAGSVSVCTPAGVPLRVKVGNNPLGSTNLKDRGLTQDGDVWTRGDWAAATSRIDLSVSTNLGSMTLDPEDGCG